MKTTLETSEDVNYTPNERRCKLHSRRVCRWNWTIDFLRKWSLKAIDAKLWRITDQLGHKDTVFTVFIFTRFECSLGRLSMWNYLTMLNDLVSKWSRRTKRTFKWNLHSKRVKNFRTTLETSEEWSNYTRNEWRKIKLHSKRVWFSAPLSSSYCCFCQQRPRFVYWRVRNCTRFEWKIRGRSKDMVWWASKT